MPAGSTPIRVLLVEDDDAYARLLERQLTGSSVSISSRRVSTLTDAVAAIDSGPVDAVLLDLGLPDSFGLDTFERIQGAAGAVPIIVLTAQDDDAIAVQAVQRGAQDYLVKARRTRRCCCGRSATRASAPSGAARPSNGKRSCGRRTRWKRSGGSPAASRTTSTTC